MLLRVSVTVHRQTDASVLSFPFVFPRRSQLTSARQGPPTLCQLSKETHTVFVRILSFPLRRHCAQNVQISSHRPFRGKHQEHRRDMPGLQAEGVTTVPVTVGWFSGPQTEEPQGHSGFSAETLILSLVLAVKIVQNSPSITFSSLPTNGFSSLPI